MLFGVGALLLAGGCTSNATTDAPAAGAANLTTTTAPRHLPGHTTWTETLFDDSRATKPANQAVVSSRALETAIYRPNGTGPFPVVVFAHGLIGHPDKFTKLLSKWADAGFVVAAPRFPLTNSDNPDAMANTHDAAEQAPDMEFVLDSLLSMNEERGAKLFGAIDDARIGAAGLSLGGLTTYNFVYGACCRDDRVDAAMVLDGFRPGDAELDGHVPLLIAHSDTDPLIPMASARAAFDTAKAPAWLVTLHGASHASQFENDVTPYDDLAERFTTDYWQATLNDDKAAYERLVDDAMVDGLSSIEVRNG